MRQTAQLQDMSTRSQQCNITRDDTCVDMKQGVHTLNNYIINVKVTDGRRHLKTFSIK